LLAGADKMALRTGIIQGLDYGVGASVTATIGKVTGGTWATDASLDWLVSIGGGVDAQWGMVGCTGTATFQPTAVGILSSGLRATMTSPSLSDLTFEGGTTSEKFRHANAKINRMVLEAGVGSALQATVDWVARTPSQPSAAAFQTADAGAIFQWFQGVCTINSATYSMQNFSVTVENNLTPHSSLDTATTDSQRFPEELVIGSERVSGTFNIGVPPGTTATAGLGEPWADIPDITSSASLAFTSATPTTLTIALAGMSIKSWSMPWVGPGDIVMYTLEFDAKPDQAAAIAIS